MCDEGPIGVTRGELVDAPAFTGLTVRGDGRIWLGVRGRGCFLGPCTPDQLREIAERLHAAADALERNQVAVAMAAQHQLEQLLGRRCE